MILPLRGFRDMGMVLVGRRLSTDELKAVREDSTTIEALIYGDLDDDDAEMPDPELDLDKSWHGIHYLLTGTAWEITEGAGAAVLGGEEIGEDNGYGPPRLIAADEVRSIAAELRELDVASLRVRWDPAALVEAEIYPAHWIDTDLESFLLPNLMALREFYLSAAAENQAVLLAVT